MLIFLVSLRMLGLLLVLASFTSVVLFKSFLRREFFFKHLFKTV